MARFVYPAALWSNSRCQRRRCTRKGPSHALHTQSRGQKRSDGRQTRCTITCTPPRHTSLWPRATPHSLSRASLGQQRLSPYIALVANVWDPPFVARCEGRQTANATKLQLSHQHTQPRSPWCFVPRVGLASHRCSRYCAGRLSDVRREWCVRPSDRANATKCVVTVLPNEMHYYRASCLHFIAIVSSQIARIDGFFL